MESVITQEIIDVKFLKNNIDLFKLKLKNQKLFLNLIVKFYKKNKKILKET